VAEKYCWVIIMAAGLSCGGRSDSSMLDFGFQLDYLVYILTYMYICLFNSKFCKNRLAQDLPERNYCAS